MAQIIVETRALAITGLATLVALIVVGTIGYNVGYGRGSTARPSTYNASSPKTAPGSPAPATTPTPAAAPEAEVPLSGEPVEISGKTVVSGTVMSPTTTGFTLEVTSQIFNTRTRQMTTKTTNYQIKFTKSTQFTERTSTITVPYGGAEPQVKVTTRTITASSLKDGQEATVTTNDAATASSLTALEVRVTTVSR